MTSSSRRKKVIIIGAGLSGTLMAIYLARRGYEVTIHERRKDMRLDPITSGRSINMTLAARGLSALKEVVDIDRILELTIPLTGRMVHDERGALKYIPYGSNKDEVIYAIKRNDLNMALMDIAETYPNVTFSFGQRCATVDKHNGKVHLLCEEGNEQTNVEADFIIGADGTFSTVRQQIHRGERANYRQEFLDCGYKEVYLPPGKNNTFQLEKHALHVWPRGSCMLMGIPNLDGSFALTCILPFEGNRSFDALTTEAEVQAFFNAHFPDVTPLIGDFARGFLEKPVAMFPTTKVYPWHQCGRVVLLGDACHTVTPFYGQGMNAAFEDCQVLAGCLDENGDNLNTAFAQFQLLRKRNTDALADLSVQNFFELRDKVRSPLLQARKKMDMVLHKLLADSWLPLYTLITHTTIPYEDAIERYRRQCRIGRLLGMDLALLALAGWIQGAHTVKQFADLFKQQPSPERLVNKFETSKSS
ncbi:MAG TPA: NAD(P)/FAD-dependent oxidoreductase [Pyrinomonadaceae bacterium]|nr:NAD(P)/FAD-dependent oxidoreductase [Pyrinomonadaceae bacterium]